MKKFMMAVLVVAFAVATPSMADDTGDEAKSGQARNPHSELREAVSKIRSFYSPGNNVYIGRDLETLSRRPRLGIILQGVLVTGRDDGEEGATILAVTPGSPADEAGLQPGDVITRWNDQPLADGAENSDDAAVRSTRELLERSRRLDDGETVVLGYLRDGSEHEVTLVAREIEFSPRFVQDFVKPFGGKMRPGRPFVGVASGLWFLPRGWSDMELVALNPELGAYFGADAGVLVVRGPKEDESFGLESGDVILRIGNREVKSPEHAMRILRSYEPEEDLTIDIIRHGNSRMLTGTVPSSSHEFFYKEFLERSEE